MATLNLELSESMQAFVEKQASEAGHSSPGEYVLALLREAQKNKAWKKVEALVIEGMESGEPIPVDEAFWEKMHRSLEEKYPELRTP